ncbi:T9SS type A sorting domain-containing protein [Lacinutrix jangbogonensis]|nr:T9SS type A sorting domain-containing protein [Lacinutrix jangbogonensis]
MDLELASGLYLVKIEAGAESIMKKIIIN